MPPGAVDTAAAAQPSLYLQAWGAMGVALGGAVIAWATGFIKRSMNAKPTAPEDEPSAVLVSGALADSRPFRDLAKAQEKIADAIVTMHEGLSHLEERNAEALQDVRKSVDRLTDSVREGNNATRELTSEARAHTTILRGIAEDMSSLKGRLTPPIQVSAPPYGPRVGEPPAP